MTRTLREPSNEEKLVSEMDTVVRTHFVGKALPDIIVLTDSDFSSEEAEVIEVRLIFDVEPLGSTLSEIAALRRDLFEMLERHGDDRIPLLRMIARAEYQQGHQAELD